jgi:urea ABC transporter urea binding protein
MSPVRVGILHSLSGTMAISEAPLIDASLMAIAQINQTGGVLGQSIEPVIEDGASDPALFEAKARNLIQHAQVNTIFSCCTSATVKSILPVFEELNAQLWYPGQSEGLNCSKNIFCTGSCPNQQVEPAVTWLLQNKGKRFYLLGSDSVFPHTVNKLIKAQLKQNFGTVVGEEYVPLGTGEFREIIAEIKHSCPDVVFNTLSGDSNRAFYRQYKESGITASEIPIMAVSVAEAELQEIGDAAVGHYASWSYFQSLDTPYNRRFVKNFQRRYGAGRVTSDPIEAAYTQVYLWKQAVEQAQSFEVERVRVAAYGQSFDAPGGFVRIEPNHHVGKPCRIGRVLPTGQFEIVFSSDNPIKPLPWLGIEELNFNASDVVIDRLAEVAQKVGQLEQKSQELDAVMRQLQDEIAKRQRVEAVLRDSEAQLQALFAAMTDIVLVIDAQGRYLKIAPTNAALLYKPADELIGKTLHEVFEPAQADTLLGYIRQVLDTQETLNIEYRRSTIGEQEVWLAASISPLSEDSVLWVARDITERKQTEIRLQLLERAIASSNNGIVITDATQPNNPIIYVNPGFECITGYSAEEVIGQNSRFLQGAETMQPAIEKVRTALREQRDCHVTLRNYRKDGTLFWNELSISPMRDETGGLTHYVGVQTDITKRKQAEEALRRQLVAVEAAMDGMAILNSKGEYIYLNEAHVKLFGYNSSTELVGKTWHELYYPDEINRIEQDIFPILLASGQWRGEAIAKKRDGSTFFEEVSLTLTEDGGLIFVCRDITECKRMEEEMRQQRNFLQTMIDHLPVAVFVKDGKEDRFGEFRLWNKTSEMMFGLTSEQAIGKIDYDFFPKEQADFFYQKDRQAFERGTPEDIPEEPINSYSLGPRILHTIKVPIYDENHEPQYLLGISEDITERKRAEEALRRQKELLQTIFDHIPVMVTFFDARGRMQLLNREMERVLGWPLAEIREGDLLTECYPDPESRQRVLDFMIAATGKWQDFKTRTKDGRQLDTSWANIRLSDGTSIGIGQDITERKQAEEILRNIALGVSAATGEEFFHLLVQYLAKALGVEYTFVGELLEPGHQRVRTIAICADGQTLENFDYDLEHTPCEKVVQRGLCIYPHSLQEQFPLDLWLQEMGIESYLGTPLLDSTGRAVGLISVLSRSAINDTTLMEKIMQIFAVRAAAELERRQAEEALRQAEERYRSIFENTDKGLFQTTPDGRYLSANPALARIYGYESPEDLIANITNINQQLYVDPNRRAEFLILMQAQGRVSNFDSQVYRKDRSLIWISENAHAVRDAKGELLYYEGSVMDITMRRVWEEALRYQKECSDQLLLNILPEPIAQRLKLGETTIADSFAEVTVLFADLVKFTELAAQIPPPELVDSLNKIFSVFDQLSEKHGLEKIKTIGDAYMVVGGLPSPRPDQAEAIAEMALDMQQQITHIKRDNGEPFHLRIGIHTGPVVAGVIGTKKFSYDLWGDTVNVASRMESQGAAGGIQVTAATYERLKEKYVFERRGTTLVKGKGEMITYWLTGRKVCKLSRRN